MLREISFKNYKSFKAKQTVKIKPFTVLVGPNSAGKSSILKLIGLLKQSITNRDFGKVFQYDGSEVNAKSFENISHNYKNEPIEISFVNNFYSEDEYGGLEPTGSYFNYFDRDKYFYFLKSEFVIEKKKMISTKFYHGDKKENYSELEIIEDGMNINVLKIMKKLDKLVNKELKELIDYILKNKCVLREPASRLIHSKKEREKIDAKVLTQEDLLKIVQNRISYGIEEKFYEDSRVNSKSSLIPINYFDPFFSGLYDWSRFYKYDDTDLFKPFPQFKNEKDIDKSLKNIINEIKDHWYEIINKADLSNKDLKIQIEYQFYNYVIFISSWFKSNQDFTKIKLNYAKIRESIEPTFQNIKFYPALRPKPKNYYTKNELKEIFGIDAESFKKGIIFENFHENSEYNRRIKELGYDYEIHLEQFNKKYDLYSIFFQHMSSKLKVPLDEMGYGFSQVLPYFGSPAPMKILEQPELHLHPKAQAALPNILPKDYAPNQNIFYLIETHSEHILRGIQLEVARGNMKNSDVAVYYVGKRKNGNSYVEEMKMTETGLFEVDWPGGLFEDGFRLTNELLSYQ